jgi:hypothetical protein
VIEDSLSLETVEIACRDPRERTTLDHFQRRPSLERRAAEGTIEMAEKVEEEKETTSTTSEHSQTKTRQCL